jgi:DNA-directed RNA polymerase specialized sigma24 family protein
MPEPKDEKLKDFVISLDLGKKKVSELRYDKENDKLKIYLTPEKENLTIDDFEFSAPPVAPAETGKPPANPKNELAEQLKNIARLLSRLTYNERKKIFLTYLKEDELKN